MRSVFSLLMVLSTTAPWRPPARCTNLHRQPRPDGRRHRGFRLRRPQRHGRGCGQYASMTILYNDGWQFNDREDIWVMATRAAAILG